MKKNCRVIAAMLLAQSRKGISLGGFGVKGFAGRKQLIFHDRHAALMKEIFFYRNCMFW